VKATRIARSGARTALAGAIVLAPSLARAHLQSTGMGPVYDGVLHFVLSPEDVVPALGLSLFAGLRGAGQGRWTLFVLPAAWLAGGLAGLASASSTMNPFLAAAWFVLVGVLVAADVQLSNQRTVAIAALLGLHHGWTNGSGMGPGGEAVVALGSARVVALRKGWTRIAVRVVGSWIAASGILLLGWAVRGR
jgi:hydrogenase/urease accessory protein HupE